MDEVIPKIAELHNKVLGKYQGVDAGTAEGWFIASLFSIAINIGKQGGLNHTQLRAVFEMYLSTHENVVQGISEQTSNTFDPATLINRQELHEPIHHHPERLLGAPGRDRLLAEPLREGPGRLRVTSARSALEALRAF